MTSNLISSAAIRKPAKDENTTLRANLALVSSKKSEKIKKQRDSLLAINSKTEEKKRQFEAVLDGASGGIIGTNSEMQIITESRPERVQRIKEEKAKWERSFFTTNASNACFG